MGKGADCSVLDSLPSVGPFSRCLGEIALSVVSYSTRYAARNIVVTQKSAHYISAGTIIPSMDKG